MGRVSGSSPPPITYHVWPIERFILTRVSDSYYDPSLEWDDLAIAAWEPRELAEVELEQIMEDIQIVIACTVSRQNPSFSDERQLNLALRHLRKMRSDWTTMLPPGTNVPTGEHILPRSAITLAATFSVREWCFARERRAFNRRAEFVTVAVQKAGTGHRRHANRIATFFSTDIKGLLAIRGK